MPIQTAHIKINGMDYLLQNNPQTVDPFNRYSKAKKAIDYCRNILLGQGKYLVGTKRDQTSARIHFKQPRRSGVGEMRA